jgi:hypothetical protein
MFLFYYGLYIVRSTDVTVKPTVSKIFIHGFFLIHQWKRVLKEGLTFMGNGVM